MKLTTENLQRFVGGQLEAQNTGEGYLYRGEIKSIKVEGDTLQVELAWMAKGEGFPPLPERWVKHDNLTYEASLQICSVSDLGGGRIALNIPIVGELIMLFPPGGSKLDPSKVEGLQLAAGQ